MTALEKAMNLDLPALRRHMEAFQYAPHVAQKALNGDWHVLDGDGESVCSCGEFFAEAKAIAALLNATPALLDAAEFKAKWDADSSLETWFPITAAELARISDELGLPQTIGPKPGYLKQLLDDAEDLQTVTEVMDEFTGLKADAFPRKPALWLARCIAERGPQKELLDAAEDLQAIEELRAKGFVVELSNELDGAWQVQIYRPADGFTTMQSGTGLTIREAIAAAMKEAE